MGDVPSSSRAGCDSEEEDVPTEEHDGIGLCQAPVRELRIRTTPSAASIPSMGR